MPVLVALAAAWYGLALHDRGIVMAEEGQILAEAESMTTGAVLYRDIDCFVTPGVWYLTALVLELAGPDLNATRVVMVALFMAMAVLVYLIAATVTTSGYALVAVVALFVLRALAFPAGSFIFYTDFALFFAMLAIHALLLADERDGGRLYLVAGTACALTILFEQSIGAAVTIASAVHVLVHDRRPRAVLAGISPIVLVLSAVGLYFLAAGALPALVHGLVSAPLAGSYEEYRPTYLGAFSLSARPIDLFHHLPTLFFDVSSSRSTGAAIPFLFASSRTLAVLAYLVAPLTAAAVLIRVIRRRAITRTELLLCLGASTTFLAAFPTPDFSHLAQALIGFVPLVAHLVFTSRFRSATAGAGLIALGATVALTVTLLANMPHNTALDHPRARLYLRPASHAALTRTLAWIEELVPPAEKIAVIPREAMYYYLSGRPIPHRHTIMLARDLRPDAGWEAARRLDAAGVDWLVVTRSGLPGLDPVAAYAPVFQRHVEGKFEQVRPRPDSRIGATKLLRRRHRRQDEGRQTPQPAG